MTSRDAAVLLVCLVALGAAGYAMAYILMAMVHWVQATVSG